MSGLLGWWMTSWSIRNWAAATEVDRRLEELAIDEGESERQEGAPEAPPLQAPGTVRHVPCQPAMEYRGRVNDWVAEIRQVRERGDTVLFVADSHGRAERIVGVRSGRQLVSSSTGTSERTPAQVLMRSTVDHSVVSAPGR